jgi:soluble lytic murein transglycosylase-like protein
MSRNLYLIGLCALTLQVWAAENITLKTGYTLAADRHEVSDGTVRIFSGDEVTEMPASLIANVEQVQEQPKVEAPAPAPVAIETPVVAQALACVGEAAPCAPAVKLLPATPSELAQTAAHKYLLPDAFVAGVMRAESGFNPAAVSPKGAIGLMQLMPATARDLGVDPRNPGDNADAGTRYLRDLLARYEDQPNQVELALAAYNAGPAAVDKYHGVPPYRETREYILRVLKAWNPPPVAPPASKEPSK